jgi:hypothetical protein
MALKWEFFVNHYDSSRYVPGSETRDNRHIQFVREFASVVSILQVSALWDTLGGDLTLTVGQNKQFDWHMSRNHAACWRTVDMQLHHGGLFRSYWKDPGFGKLHINAPNITNLESIIDRPTESRRICKSRSLGGGVRQRHRDSAAISIGWYYRGLV